MGLSLKGHIKVIAENEKNKRILFDGENTITTLFEELIAGGSISTFLEQSSDVEAGQSSVNTRSGYNNNGVFKYDKDYLITVYLLNLSEAEKNALSSNSHLLPVFDGTFNIDQNKLVGYATATYTASASKQGYLTEISGLNIINPRRHAKAWKWDAGVLNGSYNCIAVGSNVLNTRLTGFKVNRGLDFNNTVIGEKVSTGYFLRNNVKTADGSIIYTSENEILVGDGLEVAKARRVINLLTGEITKLLVSDHRYDFPLAPASSMQIVHNGFVIYNSDFSSLQRINIATKAISKISGSVTGCFIYNGYLYAAYSETKLYAYNLNTFSRVSSADLNPQNLNLPSELELSAAGRSGGLSITNYDTDKFLVSMGQNVETIDGKNRYSVICTDLMNVSGSIVDIVPQTTAATCLKVGNKNYIFGDVEPNAFTYAMQYTLPNNAGAYVNVNKKGVKFTTDGLYGNMLSFKTFEEPQTVSSSEGLTVEYYYSFEK